MERPRNDEEGRLRMQQLLHSYAETLSPNNFDYEFSRTAECTAATLETDSSPATSVFAFTITDMYANRSPDLPPNARTVHGAAVSMFFDNLTSMTLLGATKNYWGHPGVSRCLNVTYLRPPLVGDRVVVESQLVHCGKRMATVHGTLRRVDDGAVLAVCSHEKANPVDNARGRL